MRGTAEAREFGREATVGEAVFALRSADVAEDDGYVTAFVHPSGVPQTW
jgi:carotenoid cleavage dioxygenase-like enzyme